MSSARRTKQGNELSASWPPDGRGYLEAEAAKRGISPKAVLALLVEITAHDSQGFCRSAVLPWNGRAAEATPNAVPTPCYGAENQRVRSSRSADRRVWASRRTEGRANEEI